MNATAAHAQNGCAPVKACIDGHADVIASVGEGPMHRLSVGDCHVAGVADKRHGVRKAFGAVGIAQRHDVQFAIAMRPWHDPQAVRCVAAVKLHHRIEPMCAFVQRRVVPMGPAVLMPRD